MRRASNVDTNQAEIVAALRKVGCTVQHLHGVGQGCPDALIGYQGQNYLMEFKDGSKPPSARKLKPTQVKWHDEWRGQVAVVCSVDEAFDVIGL